MRFYCALSEYPFDTVCDNIFLEKISHYGVCDQVIETLLLILKIL